MRPQPLVNVVNRLHVCRVVQIPQAQHPLALADAFFRQRRGAMLFVQRVIDVLNQLGNDLVDLEVLVRGFFRRPGNNQRRARFVDQDRVDFVHDGELVAALHATRQVVLHVVAQIIESEFVVRAVRQVRAIRRAPSARHPDRARSRPPLNPSPLYSGLIHSASRRAR